MKNRKIFVKTFKPQAVSICLSLIICILIITLVFIFFYRNENIKPPIEIDNEQLISFQTNNMIFGVQKFISAMSKYLTLVPGDMIWMGTEGHSKNLSQGDVCDISISGIGTLSNPVVVGV